MIKQSREIGIVIEELNGLRVRFDHFNFEVAEFRVENGMSDELVHLYQMMGTFDRKVRALITDAEIISTHYSSLGE